MFCFVRSWTSWCTPCLLPLDKPGPVEKSQCRMPGGGSQFLSCTSWSRSSMSPSASEFQFIRFRSPASRTQSGHFAKSAPCCQISGRMCPQQPQVGSAVPASANVSRAQRARSVLVAGLILYVAFYFHSSTSIRFKQASRTDMKACSACLAASGLQLPVATSMALAFSVSNRPFLHSQSV